jgi:hypothetical protein
MSAAVRSAGMFDQVGKTSVTGTQENTKRGAKQGGEPTPGKQSLVEKELGSSPSLGPGKPGAGPAGVSDGLSPELRARMEAQFGADFSTVHVHVNSQEAEALGADAFARGDDLYFAPGTYDPNSSEGIELIAHELMHVVQQRQGRVGAATEVQASGAEINGDPGLEKEAETAGRRVAGGEHVGAGDGAGRGTAIQAMRTKRKAAADGLDNEGEPPGKQAPGPSAPKRVRRGEAPAGPAFNYTVAGGVGSVAPGVVASSNHTDHAAHSQDITMGGTEPQAPGNKPIAYVGNIVTTGTGKNKAPVAVAKQYQDEAFASPQEASERFALVVGVNSMQSVVSDDPDPAVTAQLEAAEGFQGFPLTALQAQWRPQWVKPSTDGGNPVPVPFEEVQNAARASGDTMAAALAAEDVSKKGMAPVGPLRTQILNGAGSKTSEYVAGFKSQGHPEVYVHVGDADAVSLKASPDPSNEGAAKEGLFNRYDRVIDRAKQGGKDPRVLTGGYRFRADPKFTDYLGDELHEDPHRGGAARVTPQTAEIAKGTMALREGQAKADPGVPYLPEPNLLIRADDDLNQLNFGKGAKDESTELVKSMAGGGTPAKPTTEWAAKHIVFDREAALITDGGRFDDDMKRDYKKGQTSVERLLQPAQQSSLPQTTIANDVTQHGFTVGDRNADKHGMGALYNMSRQGPAVPGGVASELESIHALLLKMLGNAWRPEDPEALEVQLANVHHELEGITFPNEVADSRDALVPILEKTAFAAHRQSEKERADLVAKRGVPEDAATGPARETVVGVLEVFRSGATAIVEFLQTYRVLNKQGANPPAASASASVAATSTAPPPASQGAMDVDLPSQSLT